MSETETEVSDYRTLLTSTLTHLRYEDIEGSVEIVGVQHLRAVLADLLQGPEAPLAGGVVVTVEQVTQGG